LAQLAYNILRLMGQLGMTGELSPVRHPAKRRRIRTVLQELVHRAALVIHKARQIILDFGQHRTHDGVEHLAKPPALSPRHAMLIVCRTKAPRR
ncbi:MAG: hypothetical protein P3W96_001695, partial [Halomonas sp.]|nr:hypothetical protein [Halomonas sp.]